MRLLFKPFEIIASLVGARLGRKTFKSIWTKLDPGDPPGPTTQEASLQKVVGAAALEAATMAAIAAAVDRATARTFHYLFGWWPEKKDKKKDEDEAPKADA